MMSAIPKNGFEVIHPSTNQLVVVAHPTYLPLVFTILVILIGLWLGIQGARKANRSRIVAGSVLLALGIYFSSDALIYGRATFDKNAGTVTFDRVGTWLRSQHLVLPLSEVRRATAEPRSAGSDHFVVIFKDGSFQDLVPSTSAEGQYKAADAVNEFLGISP